MDDPYSDFRATTKEMDEAHTLIDMFGSSLSTSDTPINCYVCNKYKGLNICSFCKRSICSNCIVNCSQCEKPCCWLCLNKAYTESGDYLLCPKCNPVHVSLPQTIITPL